MSQWLTDLTSIAVRYEGDLDLDGADGARLQVMVDEAEDVLVEHVPDLPARIAAGLTRLNTVRLVIRAAVLRAWRNPGGLRTESAGEVSLSAGVQLADSVAYTPRELGLVTGAARRRRRTIQTRPPGPWQDPA